jgi:predicted permease
MRWTGEFLFRMRALLTPRKLERELDDEIRFHLEKETEKLVDQGMSEVAARRQALRGFGAIRRQRDRARWSWGVGFFRDLQADVRLVGRQMRRNPTFTAGAILTLGLGIGANTAIFSIADQALLRRPAVSEPDRLAAVHTTCRRGALRCSSSYPDFEDYRDLSGSFVDMAAYSPVPLNVGDDETARLATGLLVSGNYFGLLGTGVHAGRTLQPSDNRRGAAASVTVLSFRFWREALGADPLIIGKTVRLNGAPYEVVGVARDGFRGLDLSLRPDLWIPILSAPALGPAVGGAFEADAPDSRGMRWIGTLVGRMEPGVSVEQARAEMDGLALRLGEQYPDERAAIGGVRGITVDPVRGYLLPRGSEAALKRFVWMLLGVVGLSLLLATANLANLLLARATARSREIGIRMAVGAGRTRVIRQLLTESLALSVVGGAAGLLVARLVLGLLGTFQLPGSIAIGDLGVGLDRNVLLFAMAISAGTALLFGLVPALQTTRPDLVRSLKGELSGRVGSGRLRKGLVALQMGLCVVLLVGSGLFIRTLRNSLASDLGFEHETVATARFNLSLLRYSEERGVGFVDQVLDGVRNLPGVREASVATLVPFQGGGFRGMFAQIDGYEPGPDEEIRVDYVIVESGYFETLGIPLLQGRTFGSVDSDGSLPVAVINRDMAERYWPGESAVGGSISFNGGEAGFEVVGVVDNPVWQAVGEQSTPFMFLPLAQAPGFSTEFLTLVARGSAGSQGLLSRIRGQFQAADPGLSLTLLRPMSELVGDALLPQRMGMLLLTMLGGLALLLAAVGIYGVVSYSVRRQARDIGIRIAVGANAGRIRRTVVSDMAVPVVVGLVGGGAAALALSSTIETFMFGVTSNDPLTFGVITVLLLLVALVATLIPARWATRLDPMRVLTVE